MVAAPNPPGSVPDAAAVAAAKLYVPSRVRRGQRAGGASPSSSQYKADASFPSSQSASDLLTWEGLPEYLKDNEYIQTGYRYDLPVRATLRSLFNLHNETGNVWSHLLGFLLFACLTYWAYRSPPTPLLAAQPHIEQLWHSVKHNVHSLAHSTLGDSLPQLPSLQQAVHQLQDTVAGTVQHLQESVHSLQGSVSDTVHHLQDSVSDTVQQLQDSVHSLQGQVQHGAQALAGELQHRLSAAGDAVWAAAQHPPYSLKSLLVPSGIQWPTARWPLYLFCGGAMSCLLLSAVCHLFGCCKKHIAQFIWRLDYTGIALLIVTSFYPIVYYSFLCQPVLCGAYLVTITLLGSATIAMSLMERFQLPEWRATRAGLFAGLGLMGIVPLLHQMAIHSHVWHVRSAVLKDIVMGLCYLAGAAVYALRVPERWFPGKFDILLHSHQIFHLFVVLGAYIHWRAVLQLLEWRDASGGCALEVTQGPLHQVVAELSAAGHHLYGVEQVWEWLLKAATEHLHMLKSASQHQ